MATSKHKAVDINVQRPARARTRATLLAAEHVRHACIEAVRTISLYGPRGIGRKSGNDLHEEILTKLRGLNLSAISSHATDRDDALPSKSNTAGQFTADKMKPALVALAPGLGRLHSL